MFGLALPVTSEVRVARRCRTKSNRFVWFYEVKVSTFRDETWRNRVGYRVPVQQRTEASLRIPVCFRGREPNRPAFVCLLASLFRLVVSYSF